MYFIRYRDTAYQWRWTLVASNGEPIAFSSEGYVHEAGCDHGIELVKRFATGAEVRRRAA